MDRLSRARAFSRRTFLGTGVAAVAAGPALAEEECKLLRLAILDMIPFGGLVVVECAIEDRKLHMLVDTGGWLTCFTEAIAAELKLPVDLRPEEGIVMYGGLPLRRFVNIAGFRIGRMRAPPLPYPLMPPGHLPEGVDGLLAPDFLANFDLDFDFGGKKLSLFSKNHCDGKAGYWAASPIEPIDILRDDDGAHIWTHVNVDGEDLKALIDTGASSTVMSMDTARYKFDIRRDDPRLSDDTRYEKLKDTKRFPFKQMTFGNVRVDNPDIVLVPDNVAQMGPNGPSLILGLSVMHHLHMYIAYREKKLYVTGADEKA
jgi:hypothetical protein